MFHFNSFDLKPALPEMTDGGLDLGTDRKASGLTNSDGSYPGHLERFEIIPHDPTDSFFAQVPTHSLLINPALIEHLPPHLRLAGNVTIDGDPQQFIIDGSLTLINTFLRAQNLRTKDLTLTHSFIESYGRLLMKNTEVMKSRILVSADMESEISYCLLEHTELTDCSTSFCQLSRTKLIDESYTFRLRQGKVALDPVASIL